MCVCLCVPGKGAEEGGGMGGGRKAGYKAVFNQIGSSHMLLAQKNQKPSGADEPRLEGRPNRGRALRGLGR